MNYILTHYKERGKFPQGRLVMHNQLQVSHDDLNFHSECYGKNSDNHP